MTSDPTAPVTLNNAIEVYLTEVERVYSPQTRAAYAQAMQFFLRFLHQELSFKASTTRVEHIDITHAQPFLPFLQDTCSIETEHLYSRAVLGFFRYAEDQRWSHVDSSQITDYLTQNRRTKRHTTPDLPLEAIELILACAQSTVVSSSEETSEREHLQALRDKAFVLTLADTGLRISEICSLRRYQVDLGSRFLTLEPEISLPLDSLTVSAISKYLRERANLDRKQALLGFEQLPLFARHDKRASKRVLPISRWTGANIIKLWIDLALPPETQRALAKNNQQITPQTFRHYFVITTLSQTGNLEITQTLARHADRSTTRRYLRNPAIDGTVDTTKPQSNDQEATN